MADLREILIGILLISVSWPAAAQSPQSHAAAAAEPQRPRLNLTMPAEQLIPPQPARMPVNSALHPAAKGALIGGAVGAGFWGAIAIWYCTIGPSEVGECENTGQWLKGLAAWGAGGAAVGALIGAIAGSR